MHTGRPTKGALLFSSLCPSPFLLLLHPALGKRERERERESSCREEKFTSK
jgi:hypothetical protein